MSGSTDQLIRGFELRMVTPECFPTSPVWRVEVTLYDDISEVLPYLSAELQGADYNHDAKVLIWEDRNRGYAFRPRDIRFAPIEDREEAWKVANDIVSTVNDIWSRRHEVKPSFERKKIPQICWISTCFCPERIAGSVAIQHVLPLLQL